MTEGSQNYFFTGLKRGFPAQWAAQTDSFLEIINVLADPNILTNGVGNLDALLNCFGYGLNICYQEIEDVPPQIVLQTATGYNLDLLAEDFFGSLISRSLGQSDASFRQQIEASFFTIGPTEGDMLATLNKLYGSNYRILQGIPQQQAWNVSNWGWDSPTAVWGSRDNSAQVMIQAPPAANSAQQTINNAAIALTRPAGVRVWMTTTAYGPQQPFGGIVIGALLGANNMQFILNQSELGYGLPGALLDSAGLLFTLDSSSLG